MSELKLIALDAEDLGILSAHLQDGVLRVADMTYLPRARRFAAVLNRFDWLAAVASGGGRRRSVRPQRRRAALHIDRVTAARISGIDLSSSDRVLALLAVVFQPGTTTPAGTITLQFAGGAAIQLDVECIEAQLKDLGATWAARSRPDHEAAAEDDQGGDAGARAAPGATARQRAASHGAREA